MSLELISTIKKVFLRQRADSSCHYVIIFDGVNFFIAIKSLTRQHVNAIVSALICELSDKQKNRQTNKQRALYNPLVGGNKRRDYRTSLADVMTTLPHVWPILQASRVFISIFTIEQCRSFARTLYNVIGYNKWHPFRFTIASKVNTIWILSLIHIWRCRRRG